MRYLKFLMIAAVLLLFAIPATGHQKRGDVDIEVVSDYNALFTTIPFKDFYSGPTRIIKRYLEAKMGENYSIIVKNNLSERIGVIIAVDGRNILTGEKSFLKNTEMMYIIAPHSSSRLEGWRTDQDTVHKFYFTNEADSYSVKTFGDTSAMGVITVAVFREKQRPLAFYDGSVFKEKAPSPAAGTGAPEMESLKRSSKDESVGTGFGDSKYSRVINVEFEAEATPYEKIFVKYELRDTLCRKGLIKCRQDGKNRFWDEGEFAPYPPDYYTR